MPKSRGWGRSLPGAFEVVLTGLSLSWPQRSRRSGEPNAEGMATPAQHVRPTQIGRFASAIASEIHAFDYWVKRGGILLSA